MSVTVNIRDTKKLFSVACYQKKISINRPINKKISISVSKINLSQYENRLFSLEKQGWSMCFNLLNNEENPFVFLEDEEFVLPLRNDYIINSNSTESLNNLISNDNKINTTNLNDDFLLRVEFDMKTDLSERKGRLNFDIMSGSQRFNPLKIIGSENAGEYDRISALFLFFQGETFLQNGGFIKCKIDGDGEIKNLICLARQLGNGKNIQE